MTTYPPSEWKPLWLAQEALNATAYTLSSAGHTKAGKPKICVTFKAHGEFISDHMGVQLVSKAGKTYISVCMTPLADKYKTTA